jgi:hypothetical protein
MLKALLIALASLVSFDALAWHRALRTELVREASTAVSEIMKLDWRWG